MRSLDSQCSCSWLVAYALLLGTISVASADFYPPPKVFLGTPTVTGALDAKRVAPAVQRSSRKLLACYKQELARAPALEGYVSLALTIGGNGKVSSATATGVSPKIEACVVATIRRIGFAKPKDGAPVEVTYSLTFDAGEVSSSFATPFAPDVVRDARGEWSWGTSAWLAHASSVPSITFGNPRVTGELDKRIIRRYVRRSLERLDDCYEKVRSVKKKLKGKVTSEFTIDAEGLVTSSAASGINDKDVEEHAPRGVLELDIVQIVRCGIVSLVARGLDRDRHTHP